MPRFRRGRPQVGFAIGDIADDGFDNAAFCTPCVGWEWWRFTGQSEGVDDECNAGLPCGGWDMLNVTGHNMAPSGTEWQGTTVLCSTDDLESPEAYQASDCHWSQYRCGGTLRNAATGAVINDRCN